MYPEREQEPVSDVLSMLNNATFQKNMLNRVTSNEILAS